MAKEKKKEGVMFPSLMSMLGIGGSTKGLLGDVTGTSGMGGVLGSLKNNGQEERERILRYRDSLTLKF